MKRKLLLATPPMAAIVIAALVLNPANRDAKDVATAQPAAVAAPDHGRSMMQSVETAPASEESVVEPPHTAVSKAKVVLPRTADVQNLSGVELGKVPAGVSRVDAVLFESRTLEKDGTTRRSRVLKTDFHFPLLQTVEWLERDSVSGEEVIVGYQTMVADHVLLQLDPKAAPATWSDELAKYGLTVRQEIAEGGLYTMAFEVDGGDPANTVVETVTKAFDWVEFAEPDYLVAASQANPNPDLPNDPLLGQLWGLNNEPASTGGEPKMDIRAFDAWRIRREAPDVIVAVIDTGIDYTHSDLKPNMWVNPRETRNSRDDSGDGIIDDIHGANFVLNSGDPMDFDGHGTHVAGTIGAVGNNGLGIVGVAWDVQLMAVQFMMGGGGSTSDAIRAIDYAWQNGAHILNNSWGGDHYVRSMQGIPSRALESAIARTRDAGAIFVTAAGNEARNIDILPSYPSYHQNVVDNVVNVGAMDVKGHNTSFSNYGFANVDVFAPGQSILSTYIGGNTFAYLSGTSMAAPHVAGMFALLKAEFPDEPYNVLIERLLQRSDSDRHLAPYAVQGRRANLAAALDPAPIIFDLLENQELVPGSPVTFTVGASGPGVKSYRWYKDGFLLSGVAGSSITLASATHEDLGRYRVEVTTVAGTAVSEAELVEVPGLPEIGIAIGAPHLKWVSNQEDAWGVDLEAGAARSGAIGDHGVSELRTTVTGPATISFSWRISSEQHYDFGRFLINNVAQAELSGESGWLTRTHNIPVGVHELVWRYGKDGSRGVADDALWLADVDFVAAFPMIVAQAKSTELVKGSSFALDFEVHGSAPLKYQWLKDGEEITGANGATLELSLVGPEDAGTYIGAAGNSHGRVTTRPIVITVVDSPRLPEFTLHPEPVITIAGNDLVLRTEWQASYPDTAQWYRDGEPLPGQTGEILRIEDATEADSGLYSVVVTNAAGSVESLPVPVKVHPVQLDFDSWKALASDTNSGAGGTPALLRFALGAESPAADVDLDVNFHLTPEPLIRIKSTGAQSTAADAVYPALVFNVPVNAIGVRYILEASTDLVSWTEVPASLEAVGEVIGNLQSVQLRELTPVTAGDTQRFLRLRVELASE